MRVIMEKGYELWLLSFIERYRAKAGAVHLHREGGLSLAASVNLPDEVEESFKYLPRGKGMAGLALERGQPVTIESLNGSLPSDAFAKQKGALVAFPVFDMDGGVRAVVSATYSAKRQFRQSDFADFVESGRYLPEAGD